MTDSAKEAALASLDSNVKCILDSLTITLREKNKRYGNSALEPANIFYKGSANDSIRIRLDDKLKRVFNSDTLRKNDLFDILGYLVLLCISENLKELGDAETFEEKVDAVVKLFDHTTSNYLNGCVNQSSRNESRFFRKAGTYGLEVADNALKTIKEDDEPGAKLFPSYYLELAAGLILYFAEQDIIDFSDLLD